MKVIILIFALTIISIFTNAQDTIKNNEKSHRFLYGISLGAFQSPEILGKGVFDNHKKLCYSILGGAMFKLNKRFSINANVGNTYINYHFHNSFFYLNDTVIYNLNTRHLTLGVNGIYNFFIKNKYSFHSQIGSQLILLTGNEIDAVFSGPYEPSLARDFGSGFNYSLTLGAGINYNINKNNIVIINCNYDRYIMDSDVLPLDEDSSIGKNKLSLSLSYYFHF